MSESITLYHFPGACSRVTMNALEEAEIDFADVPVNFVKDAHHAADYLAINPNGKVPVLVIDGEVFTENAAILLHLHALKPEAKLLPDLATQSAHTHMLSDLFWISSGLHPSVRAVRMPIRWTTGDIAPVRERGTLLLTPVIELINARVADQPYWYGRDWSIIDVYLMWAYDAAASSGFDVAPFANLVGHRDRLRARPSFKRALAREKTAIVREGIILPPGASL